MNTNNQNNEVNGQAMDINNQKENDMNNINEVNAAPANGVTQKVTKEDMFSRVVDKVKATPEMTAMASALMKVMEAQVKDQSNQAKEVVVNKTKEAVKESVTLFSSLVATTVKVLKDKTPTPKEIGNKIGDTVNFVNTSAQQAKATSKSIFSELKKAAADVKKGYQEARNQK